MSIQDRQLSLFILTERRIREFLKTIIEFRKLIWRMNRNEQFYCSRDNIARLEHEGSSLAENF